MKTYLKIHPRDTVCVAVRDLKTTDTVIVEDYAIPVQEPIPAGHKMALCTINAGEDIIKYGYSIGHATQDIPAGHWVHVHNLETNLGGLLEYRYAPVKNTPLAIGCTVPFLGYPRSNGDVGIRNELWIVPTVGCVNAIGNRIIDAFLRSIACAPGTIPDGIDDLRVLAHPYGCGQEGYDNENTQNALAMAVKHPNAGGVLVLGLGCEDNRIAEFKKVIGDYDSARVRFLETQSCEDEILAGAVLLRELYEQARMNKRVPTPLSKLRIGLECGGSDGFSGLTGNPLLGMLSDSLIASGGSVVMTEVAEMFGAETILMNRAVDHDVFEKVVEMINGYKQYCLDNHASISGNPSLGNLDGGISTLEEKSLGCIQKGGHTPVVDVLHYGQPLKKRGLNLLWAPGSDTAGTTALGLCCHMVVFTTGRGTPYGGFVPTFKVSTNTSLYQRKPHWNDFDAGKLLNGTDMETLKSALLAQIIEVASGKLTAAERNGFKEFVIWKNGISE